MRRGPSIIVAPLMLAACVAERPPPAPEQAVQPPAPVRALPAAPVGEDWRDIALTPGGWSYRVDGASGPIAQFGPPGGAALLAIRCDRQTRRVVISRGMGTGTPGGMLGFVTSFGNFGYPAAAPAGQPSAATASIPAVDPNLDKLAFSRGRFLVTMAGAPRLIVPAWPEVGRVVEDCRG